MANPGSENDGGRHAADRPPVSVEDDRLGRVSFANRIADTLSMRSDPTSLVIGLYGEGGEGKSTVLNFVERRLAQDTAGSVLVLRFNPWLYGDEEALIEAFFQSLGELLETRLTTGREKVGRAVRNVGVVMSGAGFASHGLNAGGATVQAVGEALSAVSLAKLHERVEKALRKAGKRVGVLIDDVDRLDRHEITTIMRVVKIAADFPYTAYVLAFDRDVVSAALAERYPAGSAAGENFLDKIVQVPLSLPRADPSVIRQMLVGEVIRLLDDHRIELSVEEQTRLFAALDQGVLPRLRTVRVLRRLINAIEFALPIVPGEVNAVDVILVESLRTLFPKMHALAKNDLDWIVTGTADRLTAAADATRRLASGYDDKMEPGSNLVCDALMLRLFPQLDSVLSDKARYSSEAKSWIEGKRICSRQYAERYFAYGIPPGDLADADILQLFAEADSPNAAEHLKSLLGKGTPGLALQKMVDRRADVPAGKAKALALLLTEAAGSLDGIDTGSFGMPAVQAAFLAVRLVRQLADSDWFEATKQLVATADLRFATLIFRMLRSSSQPNGEPPFLSDAEMHLVGAEFAARLAALDSTEPLALRWPVMAPEMYWVWSHYVEPNLVAERIIQSAECSLAVAAAIVRSFLPEVADHFSGRPSMSNRTDQQYQTASELIPLDRLAVAIATNLPEVESSAQVLLHEPNRFDAANLPAESQLDAKVVIRFVDLHRAMLERRDTKPEMSATPINDLRLASQSSPRSSYVFGDTKDVDFIVRVIVELPAEFQQAGQSPTASEPTQSDRDELVKRLLEDADITTWVKDAQSAWHIDAVGPWELSGRNDGDESLAFLTLTASPRSPISVRAYVQTGWMPTGGEPDTNEPMKGLRLVLDVDFRLLELDDTRTVGEVRHTTTPPPVPGALTLAELASLIVAALGAAKTAIDAAAELLSTGGPIDGARVTCWLQATNAGLDRVVKIVGFPTIPGNTVPTERVSGWTLRVPSTDDTTIPPLWGLEARQKATTDFIAALLTSAGGRDFEPILEELWAAEEPEDDPTS